MLTEKELAQKIRRIEIYTSRVVNDVLAGEYHSVFKGSGMEFSEVRQYSPGDEIRSIDWNVTARAGEPYVKRFIEERDLRVIFLVDVSASGIFGSGAQTKNEVAAELCSTLAFSAIKNNDRVGLLAFTDKIEKVLLPKKGTAHVLRVVRDLLTLKPQGQKTSIAQALQHLPQVTNKRSVVFLLSDFIDHDYERQLRIANQRHDIIVISLLDPREINLPNCGLLTLRDAENHQEILLDTSSAKVRKIYAQRATLRQNELRDKLRSLKIDHINITVGEDYIRQLVRFFKMRERRLAHGA